jgi:hypothetical protein
MIDPFGCCALELADDEKGVAHGDTLGCRQLAVAVDVARLT